jgi:hypothetical protein
MCDKNRKERVIINHASFIKKRKISAVIRSILGSGLLVIVLLINFDCSSHFPPNNGTCFPSLKEESIAISASAIPVKDGNIAESNRTNTLLISLGIDKKYPVQRFELFDDHANKIRETDIDGKVTISGLDAGKRYWFIPGAVDICEDEAMGNLFSGQTLPIPEYIITIGKFPKHLQGITTDDNRRSVFWSFTDRLVKSDLVGNILLEIPVDAHHGDLCYFDNKVYVAVEKGAFNGSGPNESWVYVYDALDLTLVSKKRIVETVFGAGGIGFGENSFVIIGGLPGDATHRENYLFEYDLDLNFIATHTLQTGNTSLGIQTIKYQIDTRTWWFATYPRSSDFQNPNTLFATSHTFQLLNQWNYDTSCGMMPIGGDFFITTETLYETIDGILSCSGRAYLSVSDPESGMKRMD